MDNITKKQHYIPQFYLKFFSDDKNNLRSLKLEDNRVGNSRHYSAFGYKPYFYAEKTGVADDLSQHVESWLGYFENILSHSLPVVISKILKSDRINDNDKYILSAFMCMLWLRTPYMRKQLEQMEVQLSKKITEFNKTRNNETEASNISHLKFMVSTFGFNDAGFTNMFFGHTWRIYIAKGKQKFITSDSPVSEVFLPPKSFFGNSFLDRDKYFPLTQEILLELTTPTQVIKTKRKTLFDTDIEKVKYLNLITAWHSTEYIYSNSKETLDELAEKRNNPGKLEMDYFIKHQKPWIEYKEKYKQ